MEIKPIKSNFPGVKQLLDELDALMHELYPMEECNPLMPISAIDADNVYFVGLFVDQALVGCGAVAFKSDDGEYAEIKRVFISASHRGRGLAKALLQHLVEYAERSGSDIIRLEVGDEQPEALRLYQTFGFERRSLYGQYKYDPYSVYMERKTQNRRH